MDKPIYLLVCILISQVRSSSSASSEHNNFYDTREDEEAMEIELKNNRAENFSSWDCNDKSSSSCSVEFTVSVRTIGTTMLTTPEPKPIVLPIGCFFNMMVNICRTILEKFQPSRIGKYFRALSRSLKGMGSNYFQKLCLKKFRKLLDRYSEYEPNQQKIKVKNFLNAISSGKEKCNSYFIAMNNIFLIRRVIRLEDYVHRVRKFGQGNTEHIGQRTRDILKDQIFKSFYALNEKTQSEIELKFEEAILEYSMANQKILR
ncbi:unnamed protein product [Arctia plantaginis]|uniref:Uncharacterized protein n=1 Tax=Arctia plantaginis TaxID=874455 RepID=A0A8S1ACV3_ARCPL|nr:unnamed protein product [Arctia plantaginis]